MKSNGRQWRFHFAALLLLLGSARVWAAPDDVEGVAVAKPQANNQFFMNDANIEANIFQPSGNAKQARIQIETRLKLQLNELGRICELTEGQKQKLKLAASSDIKRYFDDVEVVLAKYRRSKRDQEAWQNIWQEIQPLQMKLANGLFGESSFYAKTLNKTLSEEQLTSYNVVVNERRQFRYRATIEACLTSMENSVPLRHDQHEAFAKLLFDETSPPSSFGQYDQYVVMYHLAHFPEARIKSLVDDRQWKLLQVQFNQYRGMEQFLIQNGLIPKDDGEAKVLKAKVRVQMRRQMNPAEIPADAEFPQNQTQNLPSP